MTEIANFPCIDSVSHIRLRGARLCQILTVWLYYSSTFSGPSLGILAFRVRQILKTEAWWTPSIWEITMAASPFFPCAQFRKDRNSSIPRCKFPFNVFFVKELRPYPTIIRKSKLRVHFRSVTVLLIDRMLAVCFQHFTVVTFKHDHYCEMQLRLLKKCSYYKILTFVNFT